MRGGGRGWRNDGRWKTESHNIVFVVTVQNIIVVIVDVIVAELLLLH